MIGLSAVQSPSAIQACNAIQACSGITVIPAAEEEVVALTNTYSVNFDGTDDYADCGDLTPIEGLTAISINVWFKANSVSSRGSFVSKYSISNQRAFTFDLNSDGSIRFIKFASATSNTNYIQTSTTNTGFDDNAWHMATLTWVSGEAKIYIDGEEESTSEIVGGSGDGSDIQATTSNFYIGAAESVASTPDFLFQGKIDEVAVFGSVLSAAQVAAIYNSGVPVDLTSYSPIGWWRFEEGTGTSITDSSGNGNTATLTNGPTFSTDVPVYVFNRYSVDFDGTDDYATIADANDLSFGNGSTDSPFSIMAWVKMDDATSFAICEKVVDVNTREYVLHVNGSDKLQFILYDADAADRIYVTSDSAITANEGTWTMLTATYDGGGSTTGITLYVNDSAVAATGGSAGTYVSMNNTSGALNIATFTAAAAFADGKLDEFAIIPSELSAAQVAAIYNSGKPADLTSYSPTAWTRFEEGTGTSITDSSGNGHTATLTNGPTFSTDVP